MNHLTPDIFLNVLRYALSSPNSSSLSLPSSLSSSSSSPSTSSKHLNIRDEMLWVANLRLVHHTWKKIIDEEENLIWYHVAAILGLGPPEQLYANGTYQGVCQSLLLCEQQKASVKSRARFMLGGAKLCRRASPPSDYEDHPNPKRQRITQFSDNMKNRITANTLTLERFLRCVNFDVLLYGKTSAGPSEASKRWHESAWNRYRMFLFLKNKYPNVFLVPTVEIEFCWLAHIFRTEKYWKDMTAIGVDPHHSIRLNSYGETAALINAVKGTADLWTSEFGTEYPYLSEDTDLANSRDVWKVVRINSRSTKICRLDDNFFPKMGAQTISLPSKIEIPQISLTTDEIKADLLWFPTLEDAMGVLVEERNRVLQEPYSNNFELESLISRNIIPSYERFLALCTTNTTIDAKNLAPPVIIDLVWHAHQLEPVLYRDECKAYFNEEIWHDIWPDGLGVVSKISDELACLWKTTYGTPINTDWKFYMTENEAEDSD